MNDPYHQEIQSSIAPGCLITLGTALLTGVMLFINGSVVLAFLKAFGSSGSEWARDPRIMQFLLLLLPVILVVVQWTFIDYVRGRIRSYRRKP